MRSPTAAIIAWELFAARRSGFVALPLAVIGCAAIAHAIGAQPGQHTTTADILTFGLVLATLFTFGFFNFTQLDPRTNQAGFPTRLFTLPVPTRTLVTIPMLCGGLAVAGLYLAWCAWVLRPLGRNAPLVWPALVLAVGMACYHAVLWSLAALRIIRIIALSMVGIALFCIALLPLERPDSARSRLLLIPLGIGAVAYLTALISVTCQRHSAGHGKGLSFVIDRITTLIPQRTRPFTSGAHAQFWLELRRNGLLLPAATLLVMLVIPLPALIVGRLSPGPTVVSFIWMIGTPLVLAAFVGKSFARPDVWRFELGIPTFLAIRPLLPGDYLAAKLKAAAISAITAWAIVLILAPPSLYFFHDTRDLAKIWNHLNKHFPGPHIWIITTLAFASIVLITTKLLIKSAWLALHGRGRIYLFAVFAELIATVTIVILLVNSFDRHNPPSYAKTLFEQVPLISIVLAAVVIARLALSLNLLHRGTSRNLLLPKHATATFLTWLIATSVITAFGYLFFARYPVFFGLATAPWMKHLGALIGLLSFPLVRLAIAPHSFARNRHRD